MPLDNIFNQMRQQRVRPEATGEMSVREVIRQSDTSIILDSMVKTGQARYADLENAMRGLLDKRALSREEREALDKYSKEAADKAKASREIQSFLSKEVVEQMISMPGMASSEFAILARQIGAENVSKLLTSDYFAKLSVENEVLFNRFKEARRFYLQTAEGVAKVETYVANLATQWGLPAEELKAVLLAPATQRRLKLKEVLKKNGMQLAGFFDELGLAGVYSFFVRKDHAVVASLQQRLIQQYGENYLDKVNAYIDRRFTSVVNEMDAALEPDEETRKKAQAFILTGSREVLEQRQQAEFKSAHETLSNQERLDGFFKFPNKTLLDRFNDFVRERAFNHNHVDSRRGNRGDIARRLKVWWDWLPDNPSNMNPNGQAPPGVAGDPFKSRNEYVGEFIDSYLEFVLQQTGVKGSAMWESFAANRLLDRIYDPDQYNLGNKLMSELRLSHFEA